MKAIALMLVLAGCSLLSGGTTGSLDGEWQLQAGTNQGQAIPIVAGSRVTLTIKGAQVGGTAACNSFGGKLKRSGGTITISELIQTEMACLDGRLMASEAAYLAALPQVTTAARTGNSLVLSGPQLKLTFTLVPPVANAAVVGTTWVLESLISGETVSSTVAQATLQLTADGRIAASTGCRQVTGTFTIVKEHLVIVLDPYDAIACSAPLGDQDTHVLNVLAGQPTISIDGKGLTLSAADKGLGYVAS